MPDDENLSDIIHEAFESFGKIDEIILKPEDNTATIRFWIQSSGELALAKKTIDIKGFTVKIDKADQGNFIYYIFIK